jgi:hypothetical protein
MSRIGLRPVHPSAARTPPSTFSTTSASSPITSADSALFASNFAFAFSASFSAPPRLRVKINLASRTNPSVPGSAILENRRGAGNLARNRLSGGSWVMGEPLCSAESRLKAGCSQDWLPHKAARIFIIRCDTDGVMSKLCH